MLLHELQYMSKATDRRRQRNPLNIGAGMFANVFKSNTDQSTAVKVGRAVTPAMDDDGYIKYIKSIKHVNSPHFPTIGEIKPIVNKVGKYTGYVVKQELLHRLTSVDQSIQLHLLELLLGNQATSQYLTNPKLQSIGGVVIRSHQGHLRPLPQIIAGLIDIYVKYHDRDLVQLPSLRQALDVMSSLPVNSTHGVDIDQNNIMVRLTPSPTLVLTDPFGSYPIQGKAV